MQRAMHQQLVYKSTHKTYNAQYNIYIYIYERYVTYVENGAAVLYQPHTDVQARMRDGF